MARSGATTHAAKTLLLVVQFGQDHDFEGPDNITVSPHGYAVMCTDGEDGDQFLSGIAPDGRTFYANIQPSGTTLAIWGPWT